MQIIIAKEKHGDFYWDASTPEAWAASALALLTERFRAGYWYYDPIGEPDEHPFSQERAAERAEYLALTDEDVAGLPEALRREALAKRKDAQQERKEEEGTSAFYQRVKQVVEDQDKGLVTVGRGRYEREEPKAWR